MSQRKTTATLIAAAALENLLFYYIMKSIKNQDCEGKIYNDAFRITWNWI